MAMVRIGPFGGLLPPRPPAPQVRHVGLPRSRRLTQACGWRDPARWASTRPLSRHDFRTRLFLLLVPSAFFLKRSALGVNEYPQPALAMRLDPPFVRSAEQSSQRERPGGYSAPASILGALSLDACGFVAADLTGGRASPSRCASSRLGKHDLILSGAAQSLVRLTRLLAGQRAFPKGPQNTEPSSTPWPPTSMDSQCEITPVLGIPDSVTTRGPSRVSSTARPTSDLLPLPTRERKPLSPCR